MQRLQYGDMGEQAELLPGRRLKSFCGSAAAHGLQKLTLPLCFRLRA
jgi:hypothetical protein